MTLSRSRSLLQFLKVTCLPAVLVTLNMPPPSPVPRKRHPFRPLRWGHALREGHGHGHAISTTTAVTITITAAMVTTGLAVAAALSMTNHSK